MSAAREERKNFHIYCDAVVVARCDAHWQIYCEGRCMKIAIFPPKAARVTKIEQWIIMQKERESKIKNRKIHLKWGKCMAAAAAAAVVGEEWCARDCNKLCTTCIAMWYGFEFIFMASRVSESENLNSLNMMLLFSNCIHHAHVNAIPEKKYVRRKIADKGWWKKFIGF